MFISIFRQIIQIRKKAIKISQRNLSNYNYNYDIYLLYILINCKKIVKTFINIRFKYFKEKEEKKI
jgi:hypothetical protein